MGFTQQLYHHKHGFKDQFHPLAAAYGNKNKNWITTLNTGSKVTSVAYSPHSGNLGAGLESGSILISNSKNKWITEFAVGTAVNSIAFGRNGDLAAGLDDGRIVTWRWDGENITTFHTPASVHSVAYDQNLFKGYLAAGLERGGARIWAPNDKLIASLPTGKMVSVAYGPERTLAVALPSLNQIITLSLNGTFSQSISINFKITAIAYSPHGSLAGAGLENNGSGEVVIWEDINNPIT